MDAKSVADLLSELERRVDDVETWTSSLRLSNIRLSVAANCRHAGADDDDTACAVVRPRILPAFKTSCAPPTADRRQSRRSSAPPDCRSGNNENTPPNAPFFISNLSVRLTPWTDGRTNQQTDRRQKSNLVHFSLKM